MHAISSYKQSVDIGENLYGLYALRIAQKGLLAL